MRIHTDEAWEIASRFSHILSSDTRTLAAMIDNLVDDKLDRAARASLLLCADENKLALGERVYDKVASLKRQEK